MHRAAIGLFLTTIALGSAIAAAAGEVTPGAVPAPTKIKPGSSLFIDPGEFGMALSAAILKRKIPVSLLDSPEHADFHVHTSKATKEKIAERVARILKTAERVAKTLTFGAFAGSDRHFDATVTVTNRDGVVIFGQTVEKKGMKKAADKLAKGLDTHVRGH